MSVAGAKLKNKNPMLDSCGKGSFPLADVKTESQVPKKPKNSPTKKSIEESQSISQDPTDNLSTQLQDMYHQLRSIGETLQTLDYNLADGVHLLGFGICLCQLAEKVKGLENHLKHID